jgi:GNAT superfamily N-acetyltransferase
VADVSGLRIEPVSGSALVPYLEPLADLRMTVFREWPYLYEGSRDYEMRYLDVYVRSPRSLVALAWDGEHCVGATSVLPLAEAEAEMQKPFRERGMPLERYAYFGESMLLAAYRGRGVGVRFFDLREAHARRLGLSHCVFCAVDRPASHPLKPADHVANDAFWSRRGYTRMESVTSEFRWPDVGEPEDSVKQLTFWQRVLA